MIKETVKYENFDGEQVETDLYFHMSKMEILAVGVNNLAGSLDKIVKEKDIQKILEEVKKIVHGAYGERSEDGRRFIKNEEVLDRFKASPAYDEFIFTILTDHNKASRFINAIFPEEVLQSMNQRMADGLSKLNKSEV